MLDDLAFAYEQFPWFFVVVFFCFGACVGSFLNVCIFRIPKGMSVVYPGSHDLNTGEPIAWYDNIPILSWFILGGKSRHQKAPISFRYPLVEALTAGLWVTSWLVWNEHSIVMALAGMVLVSLLIPATFIDLDHMIIPDRFSVGGAAVGLVLSAAFPVLHGWPEGEFTAHFASLLTGLTGMLIGSGLIYWIAAVAEMLLKKPAMGEGDWKLVGAIGAFCGWQGAVFALFGGAFLGTILLLPVMIAQRLRGGAEGEEAEAKVDSAGASQSQSQSQGQGQSQAVSPGAAAGEGTEGEGLGFGVQVPFGPMIAAGGALYYLGLKGWVDGYFADLAPLFTVGNG